MAFLPEIAEKIYRYDYSDDGEQGNVDAADSIREAVPVRSHQFSREDVSPAPDQGGDDD